MRLINLRSDITSLEIRAAAKKEKCAKMCRRLLAIAALRDGCTRQEAEKIACLTPNVFRIWVKRFNDRGIEAIRSYKATGRPVKITDTIREKLKEKVVTGPSEAEGLSRYRIVDLQEFLLSEHHIKMTQSGIWYTLQELDLSWKTGRQRHPKSDDAVQDAFKKTSKTT
jgi:transposase